MSGEMSANAVNAVQPAPAARSWSRLDGVDLLRGLAIFGVLLNHVSIRLLLAKVPFTAGLPHQVTRTLFSNGQTGVQIFFAVSGFLITSTTIRRWGSLRSVSIREFYRLRFARIAPLLLTLLAVFTVLHAANVTIFVVHAKTGGLGRALLAALTFHVNVLEANRGYLPPAWDVLWSLSVEEMFYLFFPVICRLFGRGKLLVMILLAFVILGPFARTVLTHGNETWREYSYLGGMDAIALGCLTALLVQRRRFSRGVLLTMAGCGIAVLTLCLGFSLRVAAWGITRTGLDMTIIALGTCMVIIAAAQTKWRSPRVLTPILSLGRRSYEVYLTHAFIVLGFFHLFLVAGKPIRAVPALFVSTVIVAALLGELVGRFYSEPMNRWLRERWGEGPERLGSVVDTARAMPREATTA
jgi:peptidoglycan/LPS O-acetylase OafA/YrhL